MVDTRQVRRIGLAGAVLGLLAVPATAQAQAGGPSTGCAGTWASSCASVEVSAEDDRLFFYVPNATPGEKASAGTDGQRVRVYRDRAGMTCDPVTGRGCEDVTEDWNGPDGPEEGERCEAREEAASHGTDAPAADDGQGGEPSTVRDEEDECVAAAGGGSGSEAEALRAERRRAGAVAFAVAIPPTAFLWLEHGGPETVVRSASEPGDGGDDGDGSEGDENTGNGNTGNGGDDGNGNGNTGNGGDDGNGGDGGNGNTGNGGNGNDGNGNTGNDGNGGDGNGGDGNGGDEGQTGDDAPWPGPDRQQPPMSEVPEPVSTTLVGLGLLGYAGNRIRRRLQDDEESDAIG